MKSLLISDDVYEKLKAFVVDPFDDNPDAARLGEIPAVPAFHCYQNGVKIDTIVGADENGLRDMVARNTVQ